MGLTCPFAEPPNGCPRLASVVTSCPDASLAPSFDIHRDSRPSTVVVDAFLSAYRPFAGPPCCASCSASKIVVDVVDSRLSDRGSGSSVGWGRW